MVLCLQRFSLVSLQCSQSVLCAAVILVKFLFWFYTSGRIINPLRCVPWSSFMVLLIVSFLVFPCLTVSFCRPCVLKLKMFLHFIFWCACVAYVCLCAHMWMLIHSCTCRRQRLMSGVFLCCFSPCLRQCLSGQQAPEIHLSLWLLSSAKLSFVNV